MKKALSLLATLLIVVAMFSTVLPAKAQGVTREIVGMPQLGQETIASCWAASSEMILRFYGTYGPSVSQLQIARELGSEDYYNNGLSPILIEAWKGALERLGEVDMNSELALTFEEVINDIDLNRPIIALYAGDLWIIPNVVAYHAVVLAGYVDNPGEADDRVIVYDPWPISQGERIEESWQSVKDRLYLFTNALRTSQDTEKGEISIQFIESRSSGALRFVASSDADWPWWTKVRRWNAASQSWASIPGISDEMKSETRKIDIDIDANGAGNYRLVLSATMLEETTWDVEIVQTQYQSYAEIEFGLRSLESSGIAKVESIGVSVEGQQIWAIKISDDPSIDDESEPDILFVGLHHAREWISAEVPYHLAVNLVQKYLSDGTVRTLIDNSEIWIVPVLNPDGLEYSRTEDRMWRKNRRDNGDGTFGVDLNRNYGYMWGLDTGSSGVTSDPTYRGPSAFSEPETVAIRDLVSDPNHDFQAVLSYHSYLQLILYPWGYTHESAPDSSAMGTLATEMSDLIHDVYGETYTPQQSSQLYLTSGDLTDWVYGTTGIPAFTIELRPELADPGFQLPASEILDTYEENWPAALYLIRWVVLSQGGFMDFEDGVDEMPIRSTIPGMTFTTTEGYDWVYGDIRTGQYNVNPYGSCYYECHGNFFAWLGPNQGMGRIDFVGATATSISMLTSTYYGTHLEAYDPSANLVDSDYAGQNTQTGTMSELAVSGSNIAYVIVHDTGNYWLIDDLRVRDLLRETSAFQPPDSDSMFQTLDTIDIGAMSTYEFTNDQQQTLKLLLNWQGSQLGLQVTRPDGTIFVETESDNPPIRVVIPAAEAGTWSLTVTAIDVPFDDYPFAIDVASIPPPPDFEPPTITVVTPREDPPEALQDGVTLEANVSDPSGVDWVTFSIRNTDGSIIDSMFESIPATHAGDNMWQAWIDTNVPELPDGYYLLVVNASDMLGNEGSKTVQFSIRNWACLELLPATQANKAGRTMPVKFSLRVFENVDPDQPFVYNEELTIIIYEEGHPESILQESTYGDTARDYRIDSIGELYITNFRTIRKKLTTYVVEIYRKDMLIGAFTFETVK